MSLSQRQTTAITSLMRGGGLIMRMSIAVAATWVSLIALSAADEARATARKPTYIPPQPLAPAVQLLARERDLQVLYRSEVVGNHRTSGASGELTIDEALTALLGGTSLTYSYLDDRTVTIVPAATGSAEISSPARTNSPSPSAGERSDGKSKSAEEPKDVVGSWQQMVRLAQADQERSELDQPAVSRERERVRLEEILVTAQKREERLQGVAISMSVLAGDDLDKSTLEGITEVLNRVPGVATNVNLLGGGTQVAIRGVTADEAVFTGSAPVAYYLDSVPFGLAKSAIAPDSNAYDLERVEVLRGPQGTLYGASALNGVVRVLTKDAHPDEFEFKARTSASNTEEGDWNYRGDMAINVPFVKGKLAARAVVGYQDSSGWIDFPSNRDANNAEILNTRLKVNAQPTDRLSIVLSAWHSRTDYGAPSFADENMQSGGVLDQSISTDYDAYGLKIYYNFTGFSVSSMTSYLDYASGGALDLLPLGLADAPLFTAYDSDVYSQEVILNSSHAGPWRWSLGGIYRNAEDRLLQTIVFFPAPLDHTDISESFAVFGELTRLFVDGQLALTAGLRYFKDDVTGKENVRHTGVSTEPLFRANKTFDALSPRVVLAWYPSDQLTVYGSYAEGFRSGFDQYALVKTAAPDFPPVEPDTLKNYELGAKGSILGGRVNFDTAVYYIDWQDLQQAIVVQLNNLSFTVNVNGDSASGIGFDFGVTFQPVERLALGVNFSWNDLTMDSDVFSGGALLFAKGDRLKYSPKYIVGASADYGFPLGNNGFEGQFSASANYTSEQNTGRTTAGDSMLIARTSFSIHAPDRWVATLFADNINDERGSPLPNPFGVRDWDTRVRPRTIGVQLEYRF